MRPLKRVEVRKRGRAVELVLWVESVDDYDVKDRPYSFKCEDDQYPLHSECTRERDACALICAVRKSDEATHGNVKRTIEALTRMGHRTGIVDGEGESL